MPRPLFPPVFAPTVSHPMVDDFSIRAARMRANQQPQVPATYSLPLRKHPMWSGSNELGQEKAFAPDSNNRQSILKLEEWGPPAVWTLHLGLIYTPTNLDVSPPANQNFAVTALLDVGSGGAIQEVEVDWLNGTTVTLAMNALNVTAQYNDTTVFPQDLRLRATLGVGESTARPPTRTLVFGPISLVPSAGGNAFVRIPPFAKRVWVMCGAAGPTGPNPIYGADVKFTFARQNLSTARIATFYGTEFLAMSDGVPVPPLAQVLYVENGSANNLSSPRAVFELAL